jgi:hypothetical protein
MGIKIKLSELVEPRFMDAFGKLCQQNLPLPDSVRLARCGRVIKTANEDFQAARLAFFKANGREVKDTKTNRDGSWELDTAVPGVMERYNDEMKVALSEEIELPLLAPVKLPDSCDLKAIDLMPLLDLIQTE